jgi:sortase A
MIETAEIVAAALLVLVLCATVSVARRNSRTARALSQPSAAGAATAAVDDASLSPVVRFLRRNRWARRSMSLVSVGLLVTAVAMLGYPLYTNLYQSRLQQRLDRQFADPELEQAYRSGTVATGDALTRVKIPAIGVDVVVVEGTTASALRAGAGHYPTTPLPCEQGNVGIAGHRTTYGKPFANLDQLKPGDDIILETPVGSCTYKVSVAPYVVPPQQTDVVAPTAESVLTLTTCHPKGSAAKRLIILAALQDPAHPHAPTRPRAGGPRRSRPAPSRACPRSS